MYRVGKSVMQSLTNEAVNEMYHQYGRQVVAAIFKKLGIVTFMALL